MPVLRRTTGFSLMELLVVIGIMALLMAIIVPIGKGLRESNRTSRCAVQLGRLGQALRLYYMDERGVPPVAVLDDDNNGVPDDLMVDADRWPQLEVLWRLDYLPNRQTLHCPRHMKDSGGAMIDADSPEYYRSYVGRDSTAKPTDSLRQYRYMPYRWATAVAFPADYRRQLSQNVASLAANGTTYLVAGPSSAMPPDDTIVTWCERHVDYHKRGGSGQYIVLYWDGSAELLDEELFRDASVAPAEAWLVKPTDMAP